MKGPFELVEYSLVAVAKNHNPTILNPDFLKRNSIVPDDWKVIKPLCTDVISQVVFENGFVITVEPQRILFIEKNLNRSPSKPSIDKIAVRYIETLPHATYTAIGINFKGIVTFKNQEEPALFVLNKIISRGPWKNLCGDLKDASIKFVYDIEGGKMILTVEPSIFIRTGKSQEFILSISSNFHRDLPEVHDTAVKHMKTVINDWEKDKNTFCEMMDSMFVKGG